MKTLSAEEFAKQYGGQAVAQFKQAQPMSTPNRDSLFSGVKERVGDVIQTAGQNVQEAIAGQGQYQDRTPLRRGVEATASAFNAVPQTALAVSPEPIRTGVESIGNVVGSGFKKLTDFIGSNPQLQQFVTQNPEVAKALEEVAGTASASGQIAGTILSAKGTADVLQKGTDLAGVALQKGAKQVAQSSDDVFKSAQDLRSNVQVAVAKKNVNPQLEASAERLFMEGASKRVDNPVATYDDYLAKSKTALTDIKADPAVSIVGEKMGDAFKEVVSQRRAVGKVIGDELKTVGKTKVPIIEPKTNLLNELKDSGLSYNPKTKQLTSFQGSKFAPDEVAMLDDFVSGINKLGDNPSVSSIDNFIAKTRSNLQFTKGKSGVMGTTNAERIINGGIAGLRESLNPTKNNIPELAKYWQANKTYADLSDFVDEGSGYLGKITQSGDFAKDASIAKSSVQSILNNGKKDWMLKLEALTGYKAIDDAVLALQAMKDAGDFRGLSLLQQLSDGAIPTSKAGFTQKVIDYAVNKGSQVIAGTPEEQTRAFLNNLSKQLVPEEVTKPPIVQKPVSSVNTNKKLADFKTGKPNKIGGYANFFGTRATELKQFVKDQTKRLEVLRGKGMSVKNPTYKKIEESIADANSKINNNR